jgi:hypothetical protein
VRNTRLWKVSPFTPTNFCISICITKTAAKINLCTSIHHFVDHIQSFLHGVYSRMNGWMNRAVLYFCLCVSENLGWLDWWQASPDRVPAVGKRDYACTDGVQPWRVYRMCMYGTTESTILSVWPIFIRRANILWNSTRTDANRVTNETTSDSNLPYYKTTQVFFLLKTTNNVNNMNEWYPKTYV